MLMHPRPARTNTCCEVTKYFASHFFSFSDTQVRHLAEANQQNADQRSAYFANVLNQRQLLKSLVVLLGC